MSDTSVARSPSEHERPYFFAPEESDNQPSTALSGKEVATLIPLRAAPPLALLPDQTTPQGRFTMLQFWEGVAVARGDDDFTAIVSDKTCPSNPDEEVVIALREVARDDLSLVKPGAVFYWSIGYKDAPGEPRERVSRIRFRRLPVPSLGETEQAKARAAELATLFDD